MHTVITLILTVIIFIIVFELMVMPLGFLKRRNFVRRP